MGTGVLFVSPHCEDATLLARMLGSLSVPFEYVGNLAQARMKLRDGSYQVILTEAHLPDGQWLDILNLARKLSPSSEVIVTDAAADVRFWAEVLNLGAYDLIAQPFATSEVQRIVFNACSRPGNSAKMARATV